MTTPGPNAILIPVSGEATTLHLPAIGCTEVEVFPVSTSLAVWSDAEALYHQPVNPLLTKYVGRYGQLGQALHGPAVITDGTGSTKSLSPERIKNLLSTINSML